MVLMVLMVIVVLMVVANLMVVMFVVVEMEMVIVNISPRVDTGVGAPTDEQQGEHRLHHPLHHLLHPTLEALVQLGELLRDFSSPLSVDIHCSSPTSNTPILTRKPTYGGCGTHSETNGIRSWVSKQWSCCQRSGTGK